MMAAVAPGREVIRDPAAFIRAHTQALAPPLVPEVRLHQTSEATPIREAIQATLDARGMADDAGVDGDRRTSRAGRPSFETRSFEALLRMKFCC